MAEIGRIGQKRGNGVLYEEFLRDLQGIRGVEVYREMAPAPGRSVSCLKSCYQTLLS